jgi:hypothetical protein
MFHEIDQDRIDRVRGMDITSSPRRPTTTRGGRCSGSSVSLQGELSDGEDRSCQQGPSKPKFKVRATPAASGAAAALGVPQVRPVRICLREMAHRGELPGVHEEQLVIPVTMRRRPAAAGPRGW